MNATQATENWSVNRINLLARALGAKSYLEVGVRKGATFSLVQIKEKHAVDPILDFDTVALASEKTRFWEITSDEFFAKHASHCYDIFFIDGLHTFQQTLRDFLSTLTLAPHHAVWLIDDTVPTSIYSAHPNEAEAAAVRKRHGIADTSWHGDVYKIVPFIHDFFPNLSFATLTGGNAQTVVWRERRHDFKPAFGTLERIERLSYFDFLEHRSLYAMTAEESETLTRVAAAANSWRQTNTG